MIINNIKDNKGFKNLSLIKKSLYIKTMEEPMFFKKRLLKNEKNLGLFNNDLGALSPHMVDEESFNSYDEINKYDFRNNKIKFFISVEIAFYDFFLNTMASIILIHREIPDAFFIIACPNIKRNENTINYLPFLKDYLNLNKINHVLLEEDYAIALDNCSFPGVSDICDTLISYINNFSLHYVKNKKIKPTKKVYISRRFTPCHRDSHYKNRMLEHNSWIDSNDIEKVGVCDVRVLDEFLIEDFLIANGFEVVYPEKFKTIEEQINYFHDADTIISSTSSGLINCMFMQSHGKVIELMTPLLPGDYSHFELHSFNYVNLAYARKHTYIGIPSRFNASEIIKQISNDHFLFNLVCG